MIKNFEPRLYQQTILATAAEKNTLVVLPTGMGKTNIFLMLTAQRLKQYPNSKILFIGPTKPLIEQYHAVFREHFEIDEGQMGIFTGMVSPEKRAELWKKSKIIFSTPQGLENDIITDRINLEEVCLLGVDEAHRAVGDYSYVFVAKQFMKLSRYPRIIALTASPGSDMEKIQEVCRNLFIEDIEVRTDEDPDVKPYIQEMQIDWIKVELSKVFTDIQKLLLSFLRERFEKLKKWGILRRGDLKFVTKSDLLKLQAELRGRISRGQKDFVVWNAISLLAEIMKIYHALELLETQGISALHKYSEKLLAESRTSKTKAIKAIMSDSNFKSAMIKARILYEEKVEHPKLIELQKIVDREVGQNSNTKIMIFNQYRDNALDIIEKLNRIGNVKAKIFVGQQKKGDTGLSQKEQKQMLDDFRNGLFNVLVATSVDPNEYIILKNPERQIEIKKIGEFIDSFITYNSKNISLSKQIKGWKVLSTNDKKTDFFPITDVHRHKRQSKVVNVVLNSGFSCLVTEDHSLFSFDNEGKTTPTKPEKNKFVSIAYSVPSVEDTTQIDVIKELVSNAPRGVFKKLFCSFSKLNQPKIRMYSTELKVLSQLSKKRFKTELSRLSKKDISTIIDCTKRLEKSNFIRSINAGRHVFCEITSLGKEYLAFLKWFFEHQYYHKRKYRVSLKDAANAPKSIHKFCNIHVGVWYGKATVPPFLEVNEYLAELLGWYVAEGDTKYTKHSSDIYLASMNKRIQKRMAKCIAQGLYLKPSITWRGVASNSQIAHHLIKYVFRCGVGAYNKEIPSMIFSAPTKLKLKFLEGYFLGDGSLSKDRITFTTVSKKLATGLIFLLRQIGIKKITLRKDNCYRICVYESLPFAKIKNKVSNKTYYDAVPVALTSKKSYEEYGNFYVNMRKKRGACRRVEKPRGVICFDYIKKIEKIKKQPSFVYDLSVKGSERFYGGPGLICLHNSIGEEGLDIPRVDLVIFYEPVPSAIRSIQRRGRTGRQEKGRVIILMVKGTRDEAYRWVAHNKEKKMYKNLVDIRKKLNISWYGKNEVPITRFVEDKIRIFADYREKGSGVIKELAENNMQVSLERLEYADYIVSSRCGIEIKTVEDFVDSIIDGRLLQQIKDIKRNFERPVIVIEGQNDIYSVRNIHHNSILGMMATIAVSYGIPIIQTRNFKETAALLQIIARREQQETGRDFNLHADRKPVTLKEQQEYLVSSLPGINLTLSKPLLKHFKTIKNLVNASEKELQEVEKIGPQKAKHIKDVVDSEYKD